MSHPTDTFTTSCLNVFHGTSAGTVAHHVGQHLDAGASIIYLQEAAGRDIRAALASLGLGYHQHGGNVVAWVPSRWTGLSMQKYDLTTTAYFRKGGKTPIIIKSPGVILADERGRTLEALSYHGPPNVQRPDPPPRRWAAGLEVQAALGDWAKVSVATAQLAAGDDNVDELQGFGAGTGRWAPWLTLHGLRQYRAPKATHGHRKIDDYRKRRGNPLRAVPATARVLAGPGDHDAHLRGWEWTLR